MAKDRFLIAPFQSGLQNNVDPFLIPDDAFSLLKNAYVFRGKVRKRVGGRLMQGTTTPTAGYEQLQSRLRINLGTIGASPAVFNLPGGVNELAIGQTFSVGNNIFTVYQLGAGVPTYTTNAAITAAIDSTVNPNTITITGAAAVGLDLYYFPSLPVMGINNFERETINDELTIAWDTKYAYEYTATGWERLPLETQAGDAEWTGDDTDFFWATNWRGANSYDTYLYVTNFKLEDRMRYWTEAAPISEKWTKFNPVVNNTARLLTGRIMLPFRDRLVILNTIENMEGTGTLVGTTAAGTGNFAGVIASVANLGDTIIIGTSTFTVTSTSAAPVAMDVSSDQNNPKETATFDFGTKTFTLTGNNHNPSTAFFLIPNNNTNPRNFVNRCRFSQNGEPSGGNSFLEFAGKGGFVDAPTKEAIITAQFLRDRLIVFFESSTWELVYLGNEILPFRWQKINTELGAESTFSQIPFDKVVLGVGNVGIHACSGNSVDRIDDKIPDEVFNIHNEDDGVRRVSGIRDYKLEVAYWSFPGVNRTTSNPFPNKVLVYNYKNKSWAINDDSITTFGYYFSLNGMTWGSTSSLWGETNDLWGDGALEAKFRNTIAGNQEGFTFIVDPGLSRNSPALSITDMSTAAGVTTITAIDNNFESGEFVLIENAQGATSANNLIFEVQSSTQDSFTIAHTLVGTYTGGGTIARVSRMDILSKQYNFYLKQGRNADISSSDYLVSKSTGGAVSIDYFVSTADLSMVDQGNATGMLLGTSSLQTAAYPNVALENNQSRLWHSVYMWAEGECIQIRIYLTDDQMKDPDTALALFTLHGIIFHASPSQTIGVII